MYMRKDGTHDLCPPFTPMVDILKPAESGAWRVEPFEITDSDSNWAAISDPRGRIYSGRYVRLMQSHTVVMSDTFMERMTNYDVVRQARGNVFVAGLGIGMILVPILAKPEVRIVMVAERFDEVIEMVEPQLRAYLPADQAAKLTVVKLNALSMEPLNGWDTIYFDIWPTMNSDNYEEMKLLHRKHNRRRNPGAWIESWRRDEVRRLATYKMPGW